MTQVVHDVDDAEDPDSDGSDIQAVLRVFSSETPVKIDTFPLKRGRNLIGRAPTCDVTIDEKVVSKEHACIEVCQHYITLWDLNSRNKTKIAQRTLVPEVRYNLSFGEDVFLGGLRVHVLEQSHLAGQDDEHGSDTCSESLLTEAENMQEQRSSILEDIEGPVTSQASTVVCGGPDEAPRDAANRKPGDEGGKPDEDAREGDTSTSKQCSSSTESQTQVGEVFTLPPMPNLDFTETQGSEKSNTSHEECEAERDFREATTQAVLPERSGSPRSNHVEESGRAPVQTKASGPVKSIAECGAGEALNKGGHVGAKTSGEERQNEEDERRFNAPTQAFEEDPDDPKEVIDRLNAPTQAFADEEYPHSSTQACDNEGHLNAPTQAFQDEDHAHISAPTQGFNDDGTDSDLDAHEESRLNAATQPYKEAVNAGDDHDAATETHEQDTSRKDSFEDPLSAKLSDSVVSSVLEKKNETKLPLVKACEPPAPTRRRLLPLDTDPQDHSFVLCEASQAERHSNDDETDEDDFCFPTQPDPSPRHRKLQPLPASFKRVESLDETPPVSPREAVEETPPSSPLLVPESDPEDESTEAMVTASNSLALLCETETPFQDCRSTQCPNSSLVSSLGSRGGILGSHRRTRLGARWETERTSSKRLQLEDLEEQPEPSHQSVKKAFTSLGSSSMPSEEPSRFSYTSKPNLSEVSAAASDSGPCGQEEHFSKSLRERRLPRVSGVEALSESCAGEESMLHEDTEEQGMKEGTARDTSAEEVAAVAVDSHKDSEGEVCSEVSKQGDRENCRKRQESGEQSSPSFLLPKSPSPQSNVDDGKDCDSSKDSSAEVKSKPRERKKKATTSTPKTSADAAPVPLRSSSRRNAGSKMKQFLSIEKRTAASGNFREEPTTQEKEKAASAGKKTYTADNQTLSMSRRSTDEDCRQDANEMGDPQASVPELGQSDKEPIAEPALCDANLSLTAAGGNGTGKVLSRHSWDTESQNLDAGAAFDTCLSEPFPAFSELLRAGCAAEDEPNEESHERASPNATGLSDEATASSLNTTTEKQNASFRTPSPERTLPVRPFELSSCSFGGQSLSKHEGRASDGMMAGSDVSSERVNDAACVPDTSLNTSADTKSTRSRQSAGPLVPSSKLKVALVRLDDTQIEDVVSQKSDICHQLEEEDELRSTASTRPSPNAGRRKRQPPAPLPSREPSRRGRRRNAVAALVASDDVVESSVEETQELTSRVRPGTRSAPVKAAAPNDTESQQAQSQAKKAPARSRLAKKQAAPARISDQDDFHGLVEEPAKAKRGRPRSKPTTAETDKEANSAGCSKPSRATKRTTSVAAPPVNTEAGGVRVTRLRKGAKEVAAPAQSCVARKGKAAAAAAGVTRALKDPLKESADDGNSAAGNDPGMNTLSQSDGSRKRASVSFGGHWCRDEESESSETEEEPKPLKKQKQGHLPNKAAVKVELDKEEPRRGRKRAGPKEGLMSPPKVQRGTAKAAATSTSPLHTAKASPRMKPKVMFTGLEDTSGEEAVKSLGGTVAGTTSACTHLVTDKFRRTVKALSCIAKGIPVVGTNWLDKCTESGHFVDHVPFLLKDKAAERHLGFNLEETLRSASQEGILQGWSVHATPNVLPSPKDLKEIVGCAGGKYLARMPKRTASKTVVISCHNDKAIYSQAAKAGIPVVTTEFVLSGLLQYRLDLKKHALS